MFTKKQHENPELLKAIDIVLLELNTTDPETEQHNVLLTKLERLHKMRIVTPDARKPVSPDALITAGASLAGILIIVSYEHAHVIASKGLGFVLKK